MKATQRFAILLLSGSLGLPLAPALAKDQQGNTNAVSSPSGSGGNSSNVPAASGYVQVNLVSDLASNAPNVDARLINPWGLVALPNSIWVNDNGTGLTTAYSPMGRPSSFAINIPGPAGGSGTPSGLVLNKTDAFVITGGSSQAPAHFLMSTEDGTIAAWNQQLSGSNAVLVVDNSASGAVYKGLAIVPTTNGTPQLYAANFHAGVVDVFDGQFHPLFSFTDTNLPAGFAPFNVRNILGRLFVSFALQGPGAHDDQAGPGNGFVDIFDTDGTFLRRVASQGTLNSPWGMALAPKQFGEFSRALLIGNFGDGTINAFDVISGKFLGQLADASGNTLVIDGLWGLTFERDADHAGDGDYNARRLYFSAGLNHEQDGLLGFIKPAASKARRGR